MSAVVAQGVVKRFGRQLILDDLSLQVQEGEIYGLFGANGAGKSTLLHLLLGLLTPNAGRIHLFGLPPADARRRGGYLIAIVAAFVLFVSPLVLAAWPRLLLASGVLLLSSLNLRPATTVAARPLHFLAVLVLRPTVDGFDLARTQTYDLAALPPLLGQLGLVAVLLAAAFWSFLRRDIAFRS